MGMAGKKRWLDILGGSLAGAANGLFGGGGGMLAVPLLRAGGRDPRAAHACAIAVILPASAVSAAVYLANGFVPLPVFLPAALGVFAGGALGAKLLGKLPPRLITLVFAALMLAAGLSMAL